MASVEPGLVLQRAIRLRATPKRVLAAFFDPADLAVWWEVSRAVTLPCLLGPYAVQWPATEFEDEVLGKLGGTLHGVVMDYRPPCRSSSRRCTTRPAATRSGPWRSASKRVP
jgi:hypothetical protein